MALYDFRFQIQYYSLSASVAQTTVLIGVNPCLTEGYLKKQTQFVERQNERKIIYNKRIREIYWIVHLVKTKPI